MDQERSIITEVAYLYYKKNYSQDQIAETLFISRSTVSRMLQKALDTGIIEIKINFPYSRDPKLENFMQRKFYIRECHVLRTDPIIGFNQLSNYAAAYISNLFKPKMIVGISSGRTVYSVCSQFEYKMIHDLTFAQVKGTAGTDAHYSYDSPEIIRATSSKFGSNLSLIYSPLYIFDETARNYLMDELIIKNALNTARKSQILLVSVGGPSSKDTSIYKEYLNSQNMKRVFKKDPAATMLGHFFDKNGLAADPILEKSIIGLSLEEIKNIENVILLVYGKEKAGPLSTLLKTSLIDTLIVSQDCIEELIKLE